MEGLSLLSREAQIHMKGLKHKCIKIVQREINRLNDHMPGLRKVSSDPMAIRMCNDPAKDQQEALISEDLREAPMYVNRQEILISPDLQDPVFRDHQEVQRREVILAVLP